MSTPSDSYTVHQLLCDLVSEHESLGITPSSQTYLQENRAAMESVCSVNCGTQWGHCKVYFSCPPRAQILFDNSCWPCYHCSPKLHYLSHPAQNPYIGGFVSVHFSHSVVSDSLRPHESQHARPPCIRVFSNESVLHIR